MENNFSNVLSNLMSKFDMNDDQLASKVDVNRTTVTRWRKGIRSPKLDKLPEIAQVFNVDPKFLVSGKSESADIEIITLYKKLSASRKEKVYSFAKRQLAQQNSKVSSLDDYRNDGKFKNDVNVYGAVSAGTGEYLDDLKPETVLIKGPVPDDYDFAVKVNGNSMTPTFSDKQIIFVKKVEDDSEIRNNQFVIAEVNGDAFVKKLQINDEGIELISLNPDYKDIVIHEYDDFAIRGIVVF